MKDAAFKSYSQAFVRSARSGAERGGRLGQPCSPRTSRLSGPHSALRRLNLR